MIRLVQVILRLISINKDYCAPVWEKSCHAKKVDPELNNTCRIITGTLRSTPLPTVYRLAGIAPHIRRTAKAKTQKFKQETDPRHTLYSHVPPRSRLKSRSSFRTNFNESINSDEAANFRLNEWKQWDKTPQNDAVQDPQEELPKGTNLPRKDWVTLNRARSKVGRTQKTLHRWGLAKSSKCPCGQRVQTMEHILRECNIGPNSSDTDPRDCNPAATAWLKSYKDKI